MGVRHAPGRMAITARFRASVPSPRLSWEGPRLNRLGPFKGYLETASIIAQLDLIVSVDTSVAHLAGALGKPVWNLIQFAPDWRWFARFGERTPWYPTMRLFRQPRRGIWAPVIEQVTVELRKEAVRHR